MCDCHEMTREADQTLSVNCKCNIRTCVTVSCNVQCNSGVSAKPDEKADLTLNVNCKCNIGTCVTVSCNA